MIGGTTLRSVGQSVNHAARRSTMMVAGRKELVVEDDDGLRPALERLLDAAGFRVAAYASAEAQRRKPGY
jgi:FixJ family two-component response regulator